MPETIPAICLKCKHLNKNRVDNYLLWSCYLGDLERFNFVTGITEPVKVYCQDKNRDGKCADYEEADDEA